MTGTTGASRTALVVGATGDIGRALAVGLAEDGWRLVLVGRDAGRLDALADDVRLRGAPHVRSLVADLAEAEQRSGLAARSEEVSELELIVHAAGDSRRGRFFDLSDADWRRAIDTKLLGAVAAVRAFGDRLSSGGLVVLVTGQAARQPEASFPLGAVNAALAHLTKTLALELARRGVRVNAISPGPVVGRRLEERVRERAEQNGTTTDAEHETLRAALPLGRFVAPADIVAALRYLLTARAVTGEVHVVSSGKGALAI